MDAFDLESVNQTISTFKSQLKTKFSKLTLNSKEVKNNVESLCLIWDYSPKLADERKHYDQFKIKTVFEEKDNRKEHVATTVNEVEEEDNNKELNSNDNDDKKHIKEAEESQYINSSTHKNGKDKAKNEDNNENNNEDEYFNKASKENDKIKKNKEENDNEDDEYFKKTIKENEIIKKENEEDQTRNSRKIIINDDSGKNMAKKDKDSIKLESPSDSESLKSWEYKQRLDKKKHRLTENKMMRVYLFNTQQYIDVQIFYGETIKELKKKVLTLLSHKDNFSDEDENSLGNNRCNTKNTHDFESNINIYENLKDKIKFLNNQDAFEVRMAEEDEEVTPNMDILFEDKLNLINSKLHTVCMLEKQNFNPNSNSKMVNLGILNNKVIVKIYIKTDIDKSIEEHTTIIDENKDKTLKDLFERIKNKLTKNHFKNYDYYCFYEHDQNNDINPRAYNAKNKKNQIMEDLDNEINLDLQLKYLTSFELDVRYII